MDIYVVCECMCNILGREILEYIRRVFFVGESGNYVIFNVDGDVEGCFDVFKLIKCGNKYVDVKIGEWDKELILGYNLMLGFKIVVLFCWLICKSNEVKVFVVGREFCCWICEVCNGNYYLVNEIVCELCFLGYILIFSGRVCV